MSTLDSYLTVNNNLSRFQTMTADTPSVSLATKYYQANIGNVKSADDLVNNPRLYNYVMTAFGLGDQAPYYQGLIKKVLQQGVSSSSDLAYTLNDSRVLALAKAFNFAANGADTTQSSAVQTNVVNAYVTQNLDTTQGQQNPGVQLALYFQQNASSITDAYSVLANKNLLTVVQTALGFSPLTSNEPIDTQAKQIAAKVNFSDFQNPQKVQAFVEQFCAMYDVNNFNASGTTTNPANAIIASSSNFSGISADLLFSLQGLQLGGL
ncbi:MAG TPA: DUF1217 domain-containing protein [Beijerinckiaceae bacterium]|jgi:hypothetical protein|nr:DUF1217 domain-containing protein [Beijerinckiaceae bacterium]